MIPMENMSIATIKINRVAYPWSVFYTYLADPIWINTNFFSITEG